MTDRLRHLRLAVNDYNRMHQLLKTASPPMAKNIRETMQAQRVVIWALCDAIEKQAKEETHAAV